MKAKQKQTIAAILVAFNLIPNFLYADPASAEVDGFRIGRSMEGSLYSLQLLDSGFSMSGTLITVKFNVTSGVRYCLVAGRDAGISDIDMYVYNSEQGVLLAEDRDAAQSRAAVKWRSQYTGEATALVHIKRTSSIKPGSYSVLLGSLEIPRTGKADAANKVP
jgi:hypothetical protein